MLRITLWLSVGLFVWDFASCSITCPDGSVCSDISTCCMTRHGYSCCPYPNAVCCADLAHCCPEGFRCNLLTQMCEKEPWMSVPMVEKEAAEKPSTHVLPISPLQEEENNHVPDQEKSSIVHCDNYYGCPDGTTCCRHLSGLWYCCLYSPGWCCRDGNHCCPYGYDCDYTFTRCVRRGLRYPFTPKLSPDSVPASLISTSEVRSSLQEKPMMALTEASNGVSEAAVIRCDPQHYCPSGSTCCKGSEGQVSCCPYPLGTCCKDGKHCCQYGYTCDATSMTCRSLYSQIPSGEQEDAKTD